MVNLFGLIVVLILRKLVTASLSNTTFPITKDALPTSLIDVQGFGEQATPKDSF